MTSFEISLISMMTGISDADLFLHCQNLVDALNEIEGSLEKVAKRIADFLWTEVFMNYDIKELLRDFFE